jgi:hypothetical protein
VQRVACSSCWFSWTCQPIFLCPHRSCQPDLIESAALAYLQDPRSVLTRERRARSRPRFWLWLSRTEAQGRAIAFDTDDHRHSPTRGESCGGPAPPLDSEPAPRPSRPFPPPPQNPWRQAIYPDARLLRMRSATDGMYT